MEWPVASTDTFDRWWNGLAKDCQEDVAAVIIALQREGPRLGRPYCDTIEGSQHANMKELRVQHRGSPYRILFAFDIERKAVLLLGGDKTGDKRWYDRHIPIADRLFQEWQDRLAAARDQLKKQPKRRK